MTKPERARSWAIRGAITGILFHAPSWYYDVRHGGGITVSLLTLIMFTAVGALGALLVPSGPKKPWK